MVVKTIISAPHKKKKSPVWYCKQNYIPLKKMIYESKDLTKQVLNRTNVREKIVLSNSKGA